MGGERTLPLEDALPDRDGGDVLMVAHMNAEALEKTVTTGVAHYWSRSRRKLWRKGETSGHTQEVKAIFVDCDGDAVLLKVRQEGGACHMGYPSCYFRQWSGGRWETVQDRVFDPDRAYGKTEK